MKKYWQTNENPINNYFIKVQFGVLFHDQICEESYFNELLTWKLSSFQKKFRLKLVTLVKFLIINNSYVNEDDKIQWYKNVVGKLKKKFIIKDVIVSHVYIRYFFPCPCSVMVKATCIRSDNKKYKDIVSRLFSVNWSPHFVKSSILI